LSFSHDANEAVGENRNALQMQPIYESLVQLLETASANPNFLLQNSIHLLPGPVSPSIKVCVDSKYLPDGRKSLNKAEHFSLNFVQKRLSNDCVTVSVDVDDNKDYVTRSGGETGPGTKCSLNYTDKIILSALKDENIMAICRALGMICKVITQLYWNEAVGENRNALQMQPIYESV
jgi:hypothetical protein